MMNESLSCIWRSTSSISVNYKTPGPFIDKQLLLVSLFLLIIHQRNQLAICFSNLKNERRSDTFPQVHWFGWLRLPQIFNGLYTLTQLGKVGMTVFTQCTRKYGKTFRLPFGPINIIATSDIQIIQKLLSSNQICHINKSGFLSKYIFAKELHGGLLVSKPNVWFPHRKTLSQGFSYKSLVSYLKIINSCSTTLANDMLASTEIKNGFLEDSKLFEKTLNKCVLKFCLELVTGPGTYTPEHISQIQHSMTAHRKSLHCSLRKPYLFLRSLWRSHPVNLATNHATDEVHRVMRKIIENYKSKSTSTIDLEMEHEPLIQRMLTKNFTEKEILDQFATLVFAESEGTFTAMQFTLLHLAMNPDHQIACHKEVDLLFNSKLENAFVTNTDLTQLKYLECCILESLRLSPPIPLLARHLKAPLKVTKDLIIESGETVMMMPWVLHRNPDIWVNPNQFDPPRFFLENAYKRPQYAYIPFSAGRRNCIGWKLSIIQIKITLAWLLRHFEVLTNENFGDLKLLYLIRIVPEKDLRLVFKKRAINDFKL